MTSEILLPQASPGEVIRGTVVVPLNTKALVLEQTDIFSHFGGVFMGFAKGPNGAAPLAKWKYAGTVADGQQTDAGEPVFVSGSSLRVDSTLKGYPRHLLQTAMSHLVELCVTTNGEPVLYPFNLAELIEIDGGPGMIEAKFVINTEHFQAVFHWTLYEGADFGSLGLLLHSGDIDAQGKPREHTEFDSIEIVDARNSVYWERGLGSDGAVMEHVDTKTGVTVCHYDGQPTAFPQRWTRPVELRVSVSSEARRDVLPALSIGSLQSHGYLPAGWSVGEGTESSLGWAKRDHLSKSAALSVLVNDDPNGDAPVSKFWPHTGSKYGGVTGGTDIEILPNYDLVSVCHLAPMEVLEGMRISRLRMRSRHAGSMTDHRGEPLIPAQGMDWEVFNRLFLDDRNVGYTDPLGFTNYARQDLQNATLRSVREAAGVYLGELETWQPIDDQHLVRVVGHDISLAEMIGDAMALTLIRIDAGVGMLGQWHKPGTRSSRMNYAHMQAAEGSGNMGRGEAWVALTVSYAATVSKGDFFVLATDWLDTFLGHAAYVQMPNGALGAKTSGKAVENAPLDSLYDVNRLEEELFLACVIAGVGWIVGDRSRAEVVVDGVVEEVTDFGWLSGDKACVERFPVRVKESGEVSYFVPDSVLEQPKYALHLGIIPALEALVTSAVSDATRARFFDWVNGKTPGTETLGEALSALESYPRFGGPGGANSTSFAPTMELLRLDRWPGSEV